MLTLNICVYNGENTQAAVLKLQSLHKKDKTLTSIFRTQYVCTNLKELLKRFGYELTKIQVNNHDD